jgi:2-polyprenyl-3-methyl-5-hydroxy-6-metoxy-1,4-benzoquinol methylase
MRSLAAEALFWCDCISTCKVSGASQDGGVNVDVVDCSPRAGPSLEPAGNTKGVIEMADPSASFDQQIAAGDRFKFGENWAKFLQTLNDDRIRSAEKSLVEMLGRDVAGLTFLDVGSGSGLFSLAAMKLGATRVHSFDYDPSSVACTDRLRTTYFPDDDRWSVEQASALDADYLTRLGEWDVVYSWGVLHHTGAMWPAIANVVKQVKPGGLLYIALYNDQGLISRGWTRVKRLYNRGRLARVAVCTVFIPYFVVGGAAADLASGRNPLRRYTAATGVRGMSPLFDWFDWLGGYPFEVAKPEELLAFGRANGFELLRLKTCGGRMGCNEFVLRRHDVQAGRR